MWDEIKRLLFGTSPITGAIGSLVIVGDLATMVQESMTTGEVPTSWQQWLTLLMGVGLRFAKDSNRSHAKITQPEPQPVEQKP